MQQFFYFIIYQLSKIPLRILYVFSDFLFFLLYYVVGYRKKVIYNNLKNSFPDKNESEILLIRKKFYKYFTDYLIETLKGFSITQKELDKRHTYSNLEVFNSIFNQNKNCMMLTGHVFNWEWFIGTCKYLPSKETAAVYHKIRNPFWNEKVNAMRAKFGTIGLDMKDTLRFMMKVPNDGSFTYLFVADQSPHISAPKEWITFLNQETPVFNGFEKISIRKNMGIVYCDMVKIKRGYYHTTFKEILPKNGENFVEGEILASFFSNLEDTIKRNPANWLWSHKRWKYTKEN